MAILWPLWMWLYMEVCRCASEISDLCVCLCVCACADEKRKDRERRRGRGSLLACCIYGHFLSSLNRAGCAGNLRSLLQMVCIMFKPPCHHPSLSLFPSFSLPYAINHQNPSKLFLCWGKSKKPTPLYCLPTEGIGNGLKKGLSTSNPELCKLPSVPPVLGSFLVPTGSSAWTPWTSECLYRTLFKLWLCVWWETVIVEVKLNSGSQNISSWIQWIHSAILIFSHCQWKVFFPPLGSTSADKRP